MINRKRHHNTQKCDVTELPRDDVINNNNDDIYENYLLLKYFKYQPDNLMEDDFVKSYFATPGECTRSKTAIKLNPFDLSNPPPKNTTFNTIFMSRLFPNGFKNSKCQSSNTRYCDDNSLDSGFETESILSFASRSNDEDSNFHCENVSDVCWTEHSQKLLSKLKQISDPVSKCQGTGYLLPIVADSSSHDKILIPQISPLTLANILSGNHTLNNKITVFDCRFPYEYSGGHIANSINIHTCQKLLQTLFPIKESPSDKQLEEEISELSQKLKRDERIYVFYCEYSSYRAPKLAQCLRGLDRLAHKGNRDLFIPNIYVLFGGYREFYNQYPDLCSPKGYVPMKQTRYPLRHVLYEPENDADSSQEKFRNKYRKEEKLYFREVQDSEKKLNFIITKTTKDSDILQLFSSHPVIGGS